MNSLFALKTSLLSILLVLFSLVSIKVYGTPMLRLDTTVKQPDTTKKNGLKVKADTMLYIRTGATIVIKSDTTMVINTDNRGDKALFNSSQKGPGTYPAGTQTGKVPLSKMDSIAKARTDSAAKTKKDSSLIAKTDSLKNDTVSNDEQRARIVFLEVGGPGLAISGNYDARFGKTHNKWGYRVGAGYFGSGGNTVFTVPLQINYLYGAGDHMLELGAGTTFLHSRGDTNGHFWQFDNITGFIATGTIGYRYQPVGGHLNLRIAFVPIIYDEGLMPIGGLSVGYTF